MQVKDEARIVGLGGMRPGLDLSLDKLRIGAKLQVHSRHVLILDADPYTKQWLQARPTWEGPRGLHGHMR